MTTHNKSQSAEINLSESNSIHVTKQTNAVKIKMKPKKTNQSVKNIEQFLNHQLELSHSIQSPTNRKEYCIGSNQRSKEIW